MRIIYKFPDGVSILYRYGRFACSSQGKIYLASAITDPILYSVEIGCLGISTFCQQYPLCFIGRS